MSKIREKNEREKTASFASISAKSFITVVAVLVAVIALCGAMSYFVPQGAFERDGNGTIIIDSYAESEAEGIELWRVLSAPLRVFVSEDAVTVIMISVFLLIMSGVFNLLEKTGGVRVFISRIMNKLQGKGRAVICITVLIFMLFGSFFGMFEELVTLLPIIIIFMFSMNMDTMMGLGVCLLASCFGFATAITNPFSVGLAASVAGVSPSVGVWLRMVFFVMIYAILCAFLLSHLKKIRKDEALSPSYEIDKAKREALVDSGFCEEKNDVKIFRVYAAFFGAQALVLLLVATVSALSSLAIPLLAASFLIGGIVSGLIVCERKRDVLSHFLQGAVSMLPAVLMIALASSVKLVMSESGIMDTIMYRIIGLLNGKSKFVAILLIYFLILFLQFFIGSASAKIMLVMPIVMPISAALGLSPALVILAYCMADGFTDVIMPTNPILLVGLSVANVSYGKWVRWTWKLQLLLFALTVATLFFAVTIGY